MFRIISVICLLVVCSVHSNTIHGRKNNLTRSGDKDIEHASSIFGGKIVGGYTADIKDFPYQVYLLLQQGNDYFQCGGSIIKNTVILTAAHCMDGITAVFVRAGSANSNNGGTNVRAQRYMVHPAYNRATFDNDAALVFVPALPLDGTTIKVIPIAKRNSDVATGTVCTVSGWGTTQEDGQVSSDLMAVNVPVVSRSDCGVAYGTTISNAKICAGYPEGGKDSCQGDSGGPFVTGSGSSKYQAGIVSYGVGCARKGIPGIYSNIGNPVIRRFISTNAGV